MTRRLVFEKINVIRNFKLFLLCLVISSFTDSVVYSQENDFSGRSIRTGFGIGINAGQKETGNGLVYSIGWQKSVGKKNYVRINPNMIIGGFLPLAITDVRDQFYRITSLGFNVHYDLIRYKAVSIVTTGGGFINYSRGLLGTGGFPELHNSKSEYFYSLYFGGNISMGVRINPEKSKLAYEFRPVNVQVGNNNFLLGYMMFGIDIKLHE